MLKVSEAYMISFDITDTDEATAYVAKRGRNGLIYDVNTIRGEEAKKLYEQLTNKSIEENQKMKGGK
jgi:hypothetical protein